MTLDEIATPFGVVELDTLENNISAMDQRLRSSHIANRPHIKVHRLPDIGRMQTEGGASGIACQTVDEAETMVTNGFNEIMLTNSFVGSLKLQSILALASRASISLTADSIEAVTELSQLSEATGQTLRVYVECDIGGLRSGFTEPQEAANLAVTVTRSPRLEFGGLAAYLGGDPQCDDIIAANALLEDVIARLGHDGVDVPAVRMHHKLIRAV